MRPEEQPPHHAVNRFHCDERQPDSDYTCQGKRSTGHSDLGHAHVHERAAPSGPDALHHGNGPLVTSTLKPTGIIVSNYPNALSDIRVRAGSALPAHPHRQLDRKEQDASQAERMLPRWPARKSDAPSSSGQLVQGRGRPRVEDRHRVSATSARTQSTEPLGSRQSELGASCRQPDRLSPATPDCVGDSEPRGAASILCPAWLMTSSRSSNCLCRSSKLEYEIVTEPG